LYKAASHGTELELAEQSPQPPPHYYQARIVTKPRHPCRSRARLQGIDFPRLQVKTNGGNSRSMDTRRRRENPYNNL